MSETGPRDLPTAERIRRELADTWGEMGAAWGVTPAVARVHAYLLAADGPLTEREVREALGLSHRATTLAIAEAVEWGLVVRVPEPRRVGRRGPAGAAYRAIGDHWRWFARIVDERTLREGDPIVAALERAAADARAAVATDRGDAELAAFSSWLDEFLGFVRLFDRAIGLVPTIEPEGLARALSVLSRLPDTTVSRLVGLIAATPEDDLVALADALGRVSPSAAGRLTRLVAATARRLPA